ncbi:alpha/beta hydrolase [Solimonas sp. K1W22B-7]|uniref:alpha/beta hydrolase n=1 Tax=Solimonas sp. K1W22B-7 TaxID=2303331 RepID=UPI0013C4FD7B|nr:alpha/beta fold hydrolase [Solimonas sp. K1W22B-7]
MRRGPAVVAFLALLFAASAWLQSKTLFSPARKALESHHLATLADPRGHGLRIRSHGCMDGLTPCLLVEPAEDAAPGRRGMLLRQQLASADLALPPYGSARGIVVLLHGRNGRKEDLLPVAERFVAAGFRCAIPDLPAHGDSGIARSGFGAAPGEAELPGRVLDDLRKQFELPREPAALWGMSMGGAFAVRAASAEPRRWSSLVVVSSFDVLGEVVDRQLRRTLGPLAPLFRRLLDRIDRARGTVDIAEAQPRAWATQVRIPTLVVHGTRDPLIPAERGRVLFDALASKDKRWLEVDGGTHDRVLVTEMPLYAEMARWLVETMGHRAAAPSQTAPALAGQAADPAPEAPAQAATPAAEPPAITADLPAQAEESPGAAPPP